MKRVHEHSKGRAVLMYLGVTAMLGATALTTDVALGFLSNAQFYLRIQSPVASDIAAVASPERPSAYALGDTSRLDNSGNRQ